jgi:hypothetical protein
MLSSLLHLRRDQGQGMVEYLEFEAAAILHFDLHHYICGGVGDQSV